MIFLYPLFIYLFSILLTFSLLIFKRGLIIDYKELNNQFLLISLFSFINLFIILQDINLLICNEYIEFNTGIIGWEILIILSVLLINIL